MNILICGAQGFIGRHLCQHLQAAGHQIIQAQRRHPSQLKRKISNKRAVTLTTSRDRLCQDVGDEQWRKRLQTIIALHGSLDLVIQCSRYFAPDLRAKLSRKFTQNRQAPYSRACAR